MNLPVTHVTSSLVITVRACARDADKGENRHMRHTIAQSVTVLDGGDAGPAGVPADGGA